MNMPRQGLSHQFSVILVLVKVRHCSQIQESYTILLQLLFWSNNHILLTWTYSVKMHRHGGFSVVSIDIRCGVQYMDIGEI